MGEGRGNTGHSEGLGVRGLLLECAGKLRLLTALVGRRRLDDGRDHEVGEKAKEGGYWNGALTVRSTTYCN